MQTTTTDLHLHDLYCKAQERRRETERNDYSIGQALKHLDQCLDDAHSTPGPAEYESAAVYAEQLVALCKQGAEAARHRDAAATEYYVAKHDDLAQRAARRRPQPCAICGHDRNEGHCACTLSEPMEGMGPQGEDYLEALACRNEC